MAMVMCLARYTSNEQGNSVSAYTVASDGSLAALNTVTTVPDDFKGTSHTSEIRPAILKLSIKNTM